MSEAYLHLILNHAPIMSVLIGVFMLSYGIGFKKSDLINASLVLLIFAAVATIPVYMTGEGAEDFLKAFPKWSDSLKHTIHEHEAEGKLALISILILGTLSSFTLFAIAKGSTLADKLKLICLVLSIASFALLVRTGMMGGSITHSAELNSPTILEDKK